MTRPPSAPANRFDLASQSVIEYLARVVPLGMWSVTRYAGDRQVYLSVVDRSYGLEPGDSVAWSDTFCQYVVEGTTPKIAPDAMSVPEYAAIGSAGTTDVGAYIGIPIRHANGQVFGTLCGIDPTRQSAGLVEYSDLLHLFSDLLIHVLDADLEITNAHRRIELAEIRAETDAMTGLLNRRGWDRFLQLEEERYRRYGDPCSLLVLDLDGLKSINDVQGHAAGDDYIRRAAEVLQSTARGSDVVARLGGDEFGVVATGTADDDACTLQHRLEVALSAVDIACSIGRAPLSIKAGFIDAWQQADANMYSAKAQRRLELAS